MLWAPAIVCCLWSVASVSSKHHLDFKLNCDYECKISVRDLKFVQQESDEGIECHTSTDCQTASSCTNYKPNFAVVPPQAPRNLSLKWYIFQNNERGPEVALNITWTGYCNDNLDGFLIEVSPGRSSITFDTYVLVNNFCHEHNNTFVEINYRCFGLDSGPDRKLIPGNEYFIAVQSLPLPDFDTHQSLEMPFLIEDVAITIPDCSEDDRVEKTSYCRDKGGKGPISKTNESIVIDPKQEGLQWQTVQNIIVIAMVGTASILTGIVAIRYFSRKVSKRKRCAGKSFFIVISSSANEEMRQAGDRLACCMNKLGFEVLYSLWKATEIDNTGAVQQMQKFVTRADHIIILYSAQFDSRFRCLYSSDSDQFLPSKSDPLELARHIIQESMLLDFSVVYFHSSREGWLSEVPESQIYHFPRKVGQFCQNVLNITSKGDIDMMKTSFLISK